jgi:hypothetical protein
MKKYEALGQFLRGQKYEEVPMTFAEIERVTGAKLPKSQRYPAWWSNNPSNNVMTKIWLDAGFRTERVDIAAKKLVFKRIAKSPSVGMADTSREFHSIENTAGKKLGRHPALGSMKGTFTIEPGYDLTSPMFTSKEWAEIEKEMAEDWDQIEQGMSGKNTNG